MTARYDDLKTHDFHTHIGQYWNTYYDWHDVFSCLKASGISGTTCAYLTPKFDDMKTAVEFHHAVVEEWHAALKFASSINLEVKPLWWADPLVLRSGLSVSDAFFELPFAGIALHPCLHDWTKENSSLTDAIFEFAKGQDIPLFIHTGLSEDDSPYLFEPWFKKFIWLIVRIQLRLLICSQNIKISLEIQHFVQLTVMEKSVMQVLRIVCFLEAIFL